jgi:hypothetical protein
MENPNHKWRFLAGKIIYKWAIYTMAMLNNQRVNDFWFTRVYHINPKRARKIQPDFFQPSLAEE